jgi:hypothetical protein
MNPSEQVGQSASPEKLLQQPLLGSKTGWVAGSDGTGGVLVDFEGNPNGPVAARLAVALAPRQLQEALAARSKVVLLFEEGDPRRPFLMAFLHEPSPTPLLDSLLEQPSPGEVPTEARVDGQRVIIQGRNEVVLQCGDASITLRRNGKVIIRGVQVESHAKGRNRIKGGAVEIN